MRALKFGLPLLAFLGLAGFLLRGLWLNPREVPSPLIGKGAPQFSAPTLNATADSASQIKNADYAGKVWVLNVWASWCPTCPAEKPQLAELARTGVPVVGLNYKDEASAAQRALARHGNPYQAIGVDPAGRIGLDFGVYGTPETFVIDKAGVIRYKHIGPISTETLATKIMPLIGELQRS
jgi:cytochrome c biogenesis protein CcmG, thiol:disulfide interchange protein DsbE